MLPNRRVDSFNLSFLDVMACGLGAVILLFMLVKFNVDQGVDNSEEKRLDQEISLTQAQIDALRALSDEQKQAILATQTQMEELAALSEQDKQKLASITASISQAKQSTSSLEQQLIAQEKAQAELNAQVDLAGQGREQYLLGMKVEGQEIGVLLDYSASMTDETLIDIIKRKVGTSSDKQKAPKWQRTLRVLKWIIANAPEQSVLSVVAFNQNASVLGGQAKVDMTDKNSLTQLLAEADALVPENGTNLKDALTKIRQSSSTMDQLFIITDGLPTLGGDGRWLSGFSQCGSFFGKASTISGDCRKNLFIETVKAVKFNRRTQVNVILLPLEGDPMAAPLYWTWANQTGGILLSPAPSWP